MAATFTNSVKEEIEQHVDKTEQLDFKKASLSRVQIKKDLRIKFIEHGLIYDPEKGYHAEYRFKNIDDANTTLQELSIYDISGKLSCNDKKKSYLVYITDEKTIIKFLKLLGASSTLKKYIKSVDYKNKVSNVQRKVNFETANIKKSANAALKQLEDIKKLLKIRKLESLDKELQKVIKARKKYTDISLAELAKVMGNTSKSKLNHCFIKIRKLIGE